MCRYIKTDQFLGVMFSNLIDHDKYEIKIVEFCRLEKEINSKLREINNAILCVSINELYSTIDDYSNFFQIESDSIKIKDSLVNRFCEGNEKKTFIKKLDNYFVAGIPIDINRTFASSFKEMILSK